MFTSHLLASLENFTINFNHSTAGNFKLVHLNMIKNYFLFRLTTINANFLPYLIEKIK